MCLVRSDIRVIVGSKNVYTKGNFKARVSTRKKKQRETYKPLYEVQTPDFTNRWRE